MIQIHRVRFEEALSGVILCFLGQVMRRNETGALCCELRASVDGNDYLLTAGIWGEDGSIDIERITHLSISLVAE